MRKLIILALVLLVGTSQIFLSAPAAASSAAKVSQTISTLKKKDPSIKYFFNKSYAYAVFPTVGKAGIGIGGAYGKGRVYRQGRYVGEAELTQVSIGFQLGGQAYSEVIFFQNSDAYRKFTSGKLKFGAQVSAVAVNKGAAAKTAFQNGVAIFTATKGGLMYEATVAGQSFKFKGR